MQAITYKILCKWVQAITFNKLFASNLSDIKFSSLYVFACTDLQIVCLPKEDRNTKKGTRWFKRGINEGTRDYRGGLYIYIYPYMTVGLLLWYFCYWGQSKLYRYQSISNIRLKQQNKYFLFYFAKFCL